MIDWEQIAEQNGMSPKEFKLEIYTVASALGAMDLDNQGAGTIVKFTSSDEIGPLELYIKRGVTEAGL
tara:strand:+ start:504 stop:707 length:204 start_codon:yes stop_codon:yes gene_type:complete